MVPTLHVNFLHVLTVHSQYVSVPRYRKYEKGLAVFQWRVQMWRWQTTTRQRPFNILSRNREVQRSRHMGWMVEMGKMFTTCVPIRSNLLLCNFKRKFNLLFFLLYSGTSGLASFNLVPSPGSSALWSKLDLEIRFHEFLFQTSNMWNCRIWNVEFPVAHFVVVMIFTEGAARSWSGMMHWLKCGFHLPSPPHQHNNKKPGASRVQVNLKRVTTDFFSRFYPFTRPLLVSPASKALTRCLHPHSANGKVLN